MPTGYTKYSTVTTPAYVSPQTDINFEIEVAYLSGMNSDFSDISFIDEDGVTEITQYRERYTSGVTSTWWIKTSVPAGGKTIYMYFGNPTATLRSSGSSTFPFFDDGTGDLTGWTVVGNVQKVGGYIVLTRDAINTNSYIQSLYSANYEFGVVASYAFSSTAARTYAGAFYSQYYRTGATAVWVRPSPTPGNLNASYTLPQAVFGRIHYRDGAQFEGYSYYNVEGNVQTDNFTETDPQGVYFRIYYANGTLTVDYVFVYLQDNEGGFSPQLTPGDPTDVPAGSIEIDVYLEPVEVLTAETGKTSRFIASEVNHIYRGHAEVTGLDMDLTGSVNGYESGSPYYMNAGITYGTISSVTAAKVVHIRNAGRYYVDSDEAGEENSNLVKIRTASGSKTLAVMSKLEPYVAYDQNGNIDVSGLEFTTVDSSGNSITGSGNALEVLILS